MRTELNLEDFEVIENIPIFKEVQAQDETGNDVSYGVNELEQMAAINNNRCAEGEYPVIICGHSDPACKENNPALGFYDNFRTDVRNGETTLFARLLVYKDQVGELKKYPKRSIEVYRDTLVTPALAVLGSIEPRLELGVCYSKEENSQLMKFSKEKFTAESLNIYQTEEKMAVSEDFKNMVLEVLAETDVFTFVHEQMKDHESKNVEDEDTEMKEDKVEEAEVKAEEGHAEPADKEPELHSLQAELASVKAKYQKSEREKSLMLLVSEGCMFDVNEELNDSTDMNEVQFEKHCNRIKKFSKKAPVSQKFSVQQIPNGGVATPSVELSAIEDIKTYALKNGITFQEAYKSLKR